MKILKLTSENIKRISVVEITPDGALIQITGKNGAGKSSVLDSIAYALGGKDLVPVQPIRQGEHHAQVTVDLGEYVVTRTFTGDDKTYLTIRTKDGAKITSPQTLLDRLVGKVSFDPLAFARMEARHQVETLQALVGVDFSDLQATRKAAFEERQVVNREVGKLKAQLADLSMDTEVPDEPVNLVELMERYRQAVETQRANMATIERLEAAHDAATAEAAEVFRLEQALAISRIRLEDASETVRVATVAFEALVEPDVEILCRQIADAETLNARVRAQQQRRALEAERVTKTAQADALTAALTATDTEQAARLAAAPFPVKGLAFSSRGVTLHDIPFSQLSSAEQLKVSVAMGLAMNPTIRVILVRDGSLLDADNLRVLAEMAERAEAQVWVERVEEPGEGVGVVIEDGRVARPSGVAHA